MKKKCIWIIGIVIATLLVIAIAVKMNPNFMINEIVLDQWNDPDSRNVVCRANVKGKVGVTYYNCRAGFHSKSKREDIAATNQEDYIGEITFIDECLEHPASLFYSNDNYYVLYYEDAWDIYYVQSCYLDYGLSNEMIYVPSPAYLVLNHEILASDYEEGINTLDYLFDNYSFEEAKEFYERISEKYVQIDSKKKQITIDGYNVKKDKIMDKFVVLDFANRTITGDDVNGNRITFDGTELLEKEL